MNKIIRLTQSFTTHDYTVIENKKNGYAKIQLNNPFPKSNIFPDRHMEGCVVFLTKLTPSPNKSFI